METLEYGGDAEDIGLGYVGDIQNDGGPELEEASGTGASPAMPQQPSNSGSGLPATVRARTIPDQRPNPDQTTSPATKTSMNPTASKKTSSNSLKQCRCRRPDAPKCNTFDSFRRCLEKVNPRNEWGVAFGYCDTCVVSRCPSPLKRAVK
jgi:hypothetical protein